MNIKFVISWSHRILLLGVMMGIGSVAASHDLWLEPTAKGILLRYGHREESHEGTAEIPYDIDSILRIDCLDHEARRIDTESGSSSPLVVTESCALLFVLTSSGVWTKTPFGTENLRRDECRQPIASWRSIESAKWIGHWSPAFKEPTADDFEIVPQRDPLTLKEGQKLPLLITFEGRPTAGAIVAYDGKPRGRTEEDGRLNIRLRHSGLQMIQASLRLSDPSGTADEIVHASSLSFEVEESE